MEHFKTDADLDKFLLYLVGFWNLGNDRIFVEVEQLRPGDVHPIGVPLLGLDDDRLVNLPGLGLHADGDHFLLLECLHYRVLDVHVVLEVEHHHKREGVEENQVQ